MNATLVVDMPTLLHAVDIEQARGATTDFLLDHVGNQLVAGQPQRMVSAVRSLWVVPVELTYPHIGLLGIVGVVAIDEETAAVVAWTPIAQMKAASRELRVKNEPALSQRFQ